MSSSIDDDDSLNVSWIDWFVNIPGNECFLRVPDSFIKESLNHVGLSDVVPLYRRCLFYILDESCGKQLHVGTLNERIIR